MEDKREKFLRIIAEYFPESLSIYNRHIEECEGEETLWILLYAQIGKSIGKNFYNIDKNVRTNLFHLIEQGASSEDENLGIAVCTGLLESMTDPLMKDREVWKQAQEILGETSLQHMLGMNKFYGIE